MFTLPKPYKFSASSVPSRTVAHPLDRTAAWTSASLGDATGLTQLGVYLNRVAPHTTSTVLHWHSENDEWIYILDAGDSRPGPSVHIDPKSNTDLAPAPDAALPLTPNTKPNPDAIPIEATVKLVPDATRNTGTNTSTSTNTNTSTITITNTITNTDTNANLPPSPTVPPPPSTGAKLLILAEGANVPVEEPLHTGDFLGFAAGRRDAHALRAGDKELVYLVGGTRREHDVCFYPTQRKRMVADGSGRAGGPVFVEDKDIVAWQRPKL